MNDVLEHKKERRAHGKNWWPIIGIGTLALVLVVGIVVAVVLGTSPLQLTLLGQQTTTVEFGQVYTEAGTKVTFGKNQVDAQVQAVGQVNPDALGSYTITYTVSYMGKTATATRTVQIVDTVAPVITLIHNENSYTLPGHDYEEEGFVAEDNYDGVITDKVQRMVENGVVIYRVSDSSGNVAEARRPIQYDDRTAPEITLLGNATMTIKAGNKFNDPGVTATDNVDGDITDKVQVSGAIDIYTPGEYTIKYTVTDSYGNTTEASRTLVVEKVSQPPVVVPPGDGVIYLTFDDGPSVHTPRLLEVLAKYDVKATFFVVGTAGMGHLNKIAAGGHAIALHSNTHDYAKIYASEEAFFNDLNALRQKIKNQCGVDTTLMRFPGGSSNMVSKQHCPGIMTKLTQSVVDQGYQYFDWNVDSKDAGGAKTAYEVYQNVIRGVSQHKVSIVLQHDIHGYSVDAVEDIIKWGLENGYTFKALDSTSPGAHHPVNN